jgi:hypothetical protein
MRARRNPPIPKNKLRQYEALRRLAGTGKTPEQLSALQRMREFEKLYPGIETATIAPYERSRGMGVAEWMRQRTKAPTEPVAPVVRVEQQPGFEAQFAWADIMPQWSLITKGIFIGIRKGGLVDVYVNNTYKMTSPSLRGVVKYLAELVRDQPDAEPGAWKGYSVFKGTEDPLGLDTVRLGTLAENVGLIEPGGMVTPVPWVHDPGISSTETMDPGDFEAVEELPRKRT